ncbi:MAG: PD-(D/E)XK nuclease family protein, partial [Solirubrobacterales bacterium]|nr:PD-(D/E)XK nuclease family protein [Solirubrobacterales bacterium]
APDADRVRRVLERRGAEAPDDHVADVQRLVVAVAQGPVLGRLAGAREVRREQPFAFPLGDAADTLVNGVVDVVGTEADGTVLVVDYKTDDVEDADLEELVARSYAAQRRIYALAALHTGAPRAEVVHLFLGRPDEPVVARYEAADRDRQGAELREAAADLVAGRFPVAAVPHRGLCLTCPGRRALCTHPEELTLRPAPAAVGVHEGG